MPKFAINLLTFRIAKQLDPEAHEVKRTLNRLGYTDFSGLRMGKCFIIEIEAPDILTAKARVTEISKNYAVMNQVSEEAEVGEIKEIHDP